ncbi:alpha/beta hydrolase fold domain-containing protein [Nocardiopsis sp. RSe5-2]|uniref:Alpha/beta hydrolase fold domain-containing protein n=1 Tax=Nocardiopsis endophytica TaxID=3018445 RepID=A0ABT4TZK8_9ACTN|nr:alpha/beta hydrolase fold domain-containing protein [Nocardiopsis endophytica]MDA2810137.1 alpha/beta hydrolase fold domain-containing protein [Nocardiopsis endophytica]
MTPSTPSTPSDSTASAAPTVPGPSPAPDDRARPGTAARAAVPPDPLAPEDALALPLPPAARPAPGVELLRGVHFAFRPRLRPLAMDLWLPEDRTAPVPLVVFVHGGGWRAGRRDDLGQRFRSWDPGPFARLAQEGVAVACPEYRLSGEAVAPAQVEDVTEALAWLGARSGEIGVDPGRAVLWGESAGGHLAAMAVLAPAYHHRLMPLEPEEPTGVTVTGCVTWYAPTDLRHFGTDHPLSRFDPRDPQSSEARMLGVAPADDTKRARANSPAALASPDAPPFLILHGREDTSVAPKQAERLADALRAAGAQADLRLVDGADHRWEGLSEEALRGCWEATVAFVRDRVGRRGGDGGGKESGATQ